MSNPDPSISPSTPQAEAAAELYTAALDENALLDRLIAGEFNDLLSRAGTSYDSTADAGDVSVVLARVLAAWPRDVNSEPIPDLVDTDTANEAIRAAIDAAKKTDETPVLGPRGAVIAAAAVSTVIWLLVSVLWLLVAR